jgi:YidC/Oxa1 family membrane protein insertase
MDRTSIIAVALAIVVLVVWAKFFAPKMSQNPAATQQPTPGASPVPGAQPTPSVSVAGATKAAPGAEVAPAEKPVEETITKATSPSAEYHFTNLGGGIARAVLLKHEAEGGRPVTLNEFGSTPIGALSDQPGEGSDAAYTVTASSGEVTCERTGAQAVQIVKKFTLPQGTSGKEEYLIKLDVTFKNNGAEPYRSNGWYVYTGSAAKIHERDQPAYTAFDWYAGRLVDTPVTWFAAATWPLIGVQKSPEKPFYTGNAPNITWAGVKNQYFATIVTPVDEKDEPLDKAQAVWSRRFPLKDDPKFFAIDGALGMPGFTLDPGAAQTVHFNLYAGPKQYGVLTKLSDSEAQIMDFGMSKVVSVFLLDSMNWLRRVLGSYAAAIFVLTVCIRGAMWPLQNKATQSMKKMQALSPKMTELREKYKDDPTRMNQEMMKLYKDYGINPFSGCLPMFVQIPIFFGFFRMLDRAIELRGSKFLWVHDLSQPDTIGHLPLLGWPVNILPLCMAVTMLVQMRLTPKSGDQMQQRMFMFVPLIFIALCYNYASALALYWTVQNLFSIVQLYLTRNQAAPVPTKITKRKRGQ